MTKCTCDLCSVSLHDFGRNAREANTKLVDTYGEDFISYGTCKTWFAKFKKGDFYSEDVPRSGRPMDLEVPRSTMEGYTYLTTREMETKFAYNHSTIARGLEKLGKLGKLGR